MNAAIIPMLCQCRRCRRDAIDERMARAWLRSPEVAVPDDPEAELLARAVADLNDELAGTS